jgi:proteic killer suppression protein
VKEFGKYVILTYNKKEINRVRTTSRARKSLLKAPKVIAAAYATWEASVSEFGLFEVQKILGYHDEPLKGKLKGLRSFRLSKGYRGYYRLVKETITIVLVEEVNHHDYKEIERLFGG